MINQKNSKKFFMLNDCSESTIYVIVRFLAFVMK